MRAHYNIKGRFLQLLFTLFEKTYRFPVTVHGLTGQGLYPFGSE